jgi:methylenetetrahydrofolate reductase (NADPH)
MTEVSGILISLSDSIQNVSDDDVNAVTWGIFPGREIIQPTVVDHTAFCIWKKEAFDILISEWASIYEADSSSRRFLKDIHDKFYLINIVDNNLNKNGIKDLMKEFIEENKELIENLK